VGPPSSSRRLVVVGTVDVSPLGDDDGLNTDGLSYTVGDATAPARSGPAIIAHVCNDVGAWGRGFVHALSGRWPDPEREYRRWHRERASNDFALGAVQLVRVEDDLWVANMIGQHGVRRARGGPPPVRYAAIGEALETLAELAEEHSATVHMPRIGSGLAGGRWTDIEPLIQARLMFRGVDTTVYDLPT